MITPFEMAVSSVRVGVGVKREVGMDLKELGTKLAMVVTDPIVVKLSPVRTTIESLEQNGIAYPLRYLGQLSNPLLSFYMFVSSI